MAPFISLMVIEEKQSGLLAPAAPSPQNLAFMMGSLFCRREAAFCIALNLDEAGSARWNGQTTLRGTNMILPIPVPFVPVGERRWMQRIEGTSLV